MTATVAWTTRHQPGWPMDIFCVVPYRREGTGRVTSPRTSLEEISEEAVQCPHCGRCLSREDARAGSSRSRGWVVLAVLALLAVAMWAAGR